MATSKAPQENSKNLNKINQSINENRLHLYDIRFELILTHTISNLSMLGVVEKLSVSSINFYLSFLLKKSL